MKTSDENTTPFNRLLGTRCLFKKEGKSRYELSLGPDHLNRRGVAHGGVVASLLDTAMGAAVISSIAPEEWCGTLELSIQFREPVLPGTVAAEGRMVLPSFTTLSHCPEILHSGEEDFSNENRMSSLPLTTIELAVRFCQHG